MHTFEKDCIEELHMNLDMAHISTENHPRAQLNTIKIVIEAHVTYSIMCTCNDIKTCVELFACTGRDYRNANFFKVLPFLLYEHYRKVQYGNGTGILLAFRKYFCKL